MFPILGYIENIVWLYGSPSIIVDTNIARQCIKEQLFIFRFSYLHVIYRNIKLTFQSLKQLEFNDAVY